MMLKDTCKDTSMNVLAFLMETFFFLENIDTVYFFLSNTKGLKLRNNARVFATFKIVSTNLIQIWVIIRHIG